jgi:hypothetical protein
MGKFLAAFIPQRGYWCVFNDTANVIIDKGLTESEANALSLMLNLKSYKEASSPQPAPPSQFDFEAIYNLYPKKQGKASGIAWLKAHVKTEHAYSDLRRAVRAYADSRVGQDSKFTKHFNFWVKVYRDWVPEKPESRPMTVEQLGFGDRL